MRLYFVKRIEFVMISCAMAMGVLLSVSAEEQEKNSATGNGRIEGIVRPYVYQVVLPTYVDGTFDFIMDPQHLIEDMDPALFGGLSFEKEATVFFRRLDGKTKDNYSSSSDHMTIVNRSSIPIEVFVSVSVSAESLGGITMTNDKTFTEDKGASLYMALTDGENTVPVVAGTAYIQTILPAAPEEAFEYVYDRENREYRYDLKENLSGMQFPEWCFQLIGSVNEDEGWAFVERAAPLITVTWKVMPAKI